MIRATPTLIAATAIVVLPLCTVAGLFPPLAPVCYVGLAVFAAIAAADALRANRAISGWKASTPPLLKWFKDREAVLPVSIENRSAMQHEIRLHVAFPPEIEPKENTLAVRIQRRRNCRCGVHSAPPRRFRAPRLQHRTAFAHALLVCQPGASDRY